MDATTTRERDWPQDSAWAVYYPRVVGAAHRLMLRKGLDWAPNHSNFKRLVISGCHAADDALAALRDESPADWATMSEDLRVRAALRAAVRAMAKFLLE